MSNSRSLWPCQFFQAGNCQDAQCPFVHQFAGFPGQLQGPGPGLLPTPGPAPLMSVPLMDMSGPMARVRNSVPPQMRPGIQCKYELTSKGCSKRNCKFFHRNREEKSLNSPKTNSLTHPASSNQKVSDAQKQTIMREVLEDHISPNELARKYNLSPDTIRGWIKRAGKKLPKVYRKAEHSTVNAPTGQSLSVDNKDLDLDGTSTQHQKDLSKCVEQKISSTELSGKNYEQKNSDLVDGPITSLPEPSPTVVNKKKNMLKVIDEKLLKEPDIDKVNAETRKKNSSMEYREHGVIAQQKPAATEKRKINPKEQLEDGKVQPLKIVKSATLILEEEEQPMKKVKLCNIMTGIGESSKENTNFKQMFNPEPEVILVGESESVDDIKKENDEIRKEKISLAKQLEELQKENNALIKENVEFKTKVAQYQKGAMVWNATLARSKTDLADERKKSAQKTNKMSQLSKDKIAKEKKLTDELNDLKKQIANHNNDVEKERDQLDSDLMDLKEEKSKQDVIIEELKLKIQKLESVDKKTVKISKKDLINQARTAKVKQIENWEELNLKIQQLERKEENEESRQDIINQAGKLKIKQIEKTLQERKKVWLKKIELFKDKLATKEEKTYELQELLEIKEVDLTNMKNDLEAMEKERDDLDSTLVDLRAELGEKELIIVQLESKQNDNREVEEMLAEIQNTKDQKIKKLHEKLKEKSDLFKQQTVVIKKLNSQKAELENSKNDVNKRVEETESILTVKQEEIEIMKKNIDELNSKLEEQKSGSTMINLEKQNKSLKDELSKHETDVLNLQNEIKTQEERIKKYKEMFLNLANSM